MLAALTANINRAENTESISPNSFLRYPAAEGELIEGMSIESIVISLNMVPSSKLAANFLEMRDKLMSTYIWVSDRFLYY